ncbi:hypothetical protein V6N12_050084 [Hibiscus sabdariffa]|uniref:Uncharacterized protein n=1 Tax=Hibiscus sabdariffa TaxID=183260 RepID=A0ABR2GBJ3_9ROSI
MGRSKSFRDPSSDFNCDGLVLIHNDDTVRQVIRLLVTKGIADIYVDHKIDEDGSSNINDDTEVNVEEAVGVEGSYDLGPDIKTFEATGEVLKTTIEEFDDTVLEYATDDGPRGIANGGGPKEVADGFDHACDGGPRGAVDEDADGPMWDFNGPIEDADGFDLACDGGAKGAADGGDGEQSDAGGEPSNATGNVICEDLDENKKYENFKKNGKTMVDDGNGDIDDSMVGDDVVYEIELKETDGKLKGNESEYLDSSSPGEYGASDESEP